MREKCNVLFLCWANSVRSIMAEALLRAICSDRFNAFSAGVEPAAHVHPGALELLRRAVPVDELRPKTWQHYASLRAEPMDIVVAMCAQTAALQPNLFPGMPLFCTWHFPDPLENLTDARSRRKSFERVFRQLAVRIHVFAALPVERLQRRGNW